MGAFWVQSSPVSAPEASRLRTFLPAAAAAVLVIAGFTVLLSRSRAYVSARPAGDEPYNLVVEGFRAGHVWLAKDAPPALALAANPYDFVTYRPYLKPPWNLIDLSYYRGRLYAYFGVTPAVILFWPYRALFGAPLHQATAVLLFAVVGYLAALGLALAAWRRHFPQVGPWAGAVLAVLLGSVTTLPVFLVRPGLYEVSISCAFALVMLCLACLWKGWHRGDRGFGWYAAASLAYGLAVGARPSLLFGAVVLFIPAGASLRARALGRGDTPWLRELLAALLPISAIGAGLAAYNYYRFDSALQFGHDYQLSGNNVYGTKSFEPRFLWDNLRLYFLEPLRWHGAFPFVWEPVCPPLAPGHLPVEFFFGTLANLPVLLAAALVPFVCAGSGARPLSRAAAVPAVLFLVVAATICSYAGATSRYLLDFIPALALLAALGFLGVEALLGRAGGGPPTPAQEALRRSALAPAVRPVLYAALAYSVAVSWLLAIALGSFYRGAEEGVALLGSGRIREAAAAYEGVCRINPDFRGQAELGIGTALLGQGLTKEGAGVLAAAVHDDPRLQAAQFNLGKALLSMGRAAQAVEAFRRAAALDPYDAEAEADLGVALVRSGHLDEAIDHLQAALRIDPTLAQARDNLRALEWVARSRGRK